MSELTRRYAQALYQVCPDEDGLRETAGALMGDVELDVPLVVESALLGGFTLDIEGVTYDKSVRGALRRLGRQLEERRMA